MLRLLYLALWKLVAITKPRLFKCIEIFTFQPKHFQVKNAYIFHISAQNIDCGYSLEPPRRGGSNKYPQFMFLSSNKKNDVKLCKPQFYYIKVGFRGGGQNFIGMFLWCRVFVCSFALILMLSVGYVLWLWLFFGIYTIWSRDCHWFFLLLLNLTYILQTTLFITALVTTTQMTIWLSRKLHMRGNN